VRPQRTPPSGGTARTQQKSSGAGTVTVLTTRAGTATAIGFRGNQETDDHAKPVQHDQDNSTAEDPLLGVPASECTAGILGPNIRKARIL
jgi:hypothetical protein